MKKKKLMPLQVDVLKTLSDSEGHSVLGGSLSIYVSTSRPR